MKLLYFAWIRTQLGISEETIVLPEAVSDVQTLVGWLINRDENFKNTFLEHSLIQVAVNQEYVEFDCPVKSGDEVAFFPPVTGG